MLTKTDLSQIQKIIQKEVRVIVREEVENEAQSIKDELRSEIKMSMIRTHSEIRELKDKVKNLEIRITRMHNELQKEIKIIVDFLDRDHLQLRLSHLCHSVLARPERGRRDTESIQIITGIDSRPSVLSSGSKDFRGNDM